MIVALGAPRDGATPSTVSALGIAEGTVKSGVHRARRRLRATGDPEAMLDDVEVVLRADLDLLVPAFDRCETAVAMLEADPTRPVGAVARDLAVSTAQLGRESDVSSG
jgi:hypothetical protein